MTRYLSEKYHAHLHELFSSTVVEVVDQETNKMVFQKHYPRYNDALKEFKGLDSYYWRVIKDNEIREENKNDME